MPLFYQTILSETANLDTSSLRFISKHHSLSLDSSDKDKGEVWAAVYGTECQFSWRRVVCVLHNDGVRIVQEYAFTAPEYRDPDSVLEILNYFVPFVSVLEIVSKEEESERFMVVVSDQSAANGKLNIEFYFMNTAPEECLLFLKTLANQAKVYNPRAARVSSRGNHDNLQGLALDNLQEQTGFSKLYEITNIRVRKAEELDMSLEDALGVVLTVIETVDGQGAPSELVDSLNYRNLLNVPAAWMFCFHASRFKNSKSSEYLQQVAKSLDFILESNSPLIRLDVDSTSAFFRLRQDALTSLKSYSKRLKRRNPTSKGGIMNRSKGKPFGSYPLTSDFSKMATILETRRQFQERQNSDQFVQKFDSDPKINIISNWNQSLLLNFENSTFSVLRVCLTEILNGIFSMKKSNVKLKHRLLRDYISILLSNFNDDNGILREIISLIKGRPFPNIEHFHWPNIEEIHKSLCENHAQVTQALLGKNSFNHYISDVFSHTRDIIRKEDLNVLPNVLKLLWISLCDNYARSDPKDRFDVSESFAAYIADFVATIEPSDTLKDAFLDIMFNISSNYGKSKSKENDIVYDCLISSPGIWKGLMIFLSRASPSIRDSALTQILSSVKASSSNCFQIAAQSNWNIWLLLCIQEDLFLISENFASRKSTFDAKFRSYKNSAEDNSSEEDEEIVEGMKESRATSFAEELSLLSRQYSIQNAIAIYTEIFFFLFVNNEEFTEEFLSFVCSLYLLGKPVPKWKKAYYFLVKYLIRSITIKIATHIDMFPSGFSGLHWDHLIDWFFIVRTLIFESPDWNSFVTADSLQADFKLPVSMKNATPSKRMNVRSFGIRVSNQNIVEDLPILSDLMALFCSDRISKVQNENIQEWLSEPEKEILEVLFRISDFLKDSQVLLNLVQEELSRGLDCKKFTALLPEFIGEYKITKLSSDKRKEILANLIDASMINFT